MVVATRVGRVVVRLVGFAILAKLFGLLGLQFGHIVGSMRAASFSGTSVMVPLAGLFGGVWECGVLSAFLMAGSWCKGVAILKASTYGIPSFFGALYWVRPSLLTRCGVPAVCMILFWLHPVGFAAFAYALYWLIPISLYWYGRRYGNRFYLDAIGSTFVAHAVGSVIWLYTIPMSPQTWLLLVPIVIQERLLIAGWMMVVYLAATYVVRVYARMASFYSWLPSPRFTCRRVHV